VKHAYVFWNAGVCHVLTYPGQQRIASSKHFRRATRAARNLGFAVKVYKGSTVGAPRDAVRVSDGSYVLPAV
jgi:hypothetical protein